MTKNVGKVDKTLRIIVGALLILAVFVGPKTLWGWIGLIPLVTGLMNWCPLYIPFKLSTAKKEK